VAFVAGLLSSSGAHAVETELLTVAVMDQDLVPTPCMIQIKNDVSDEVKGPENAMHFGEATGWLGVPFKKTVEINSPREQFWAVEAGPVEFDLSPGSWTVRPVPI
jgi:hypothetical protein